MKQPPAPFQGRTEILDLPLAATQTARQRRAPPGLGIVFTLKPACISDYPRPNSPQNQNSRLPGGSRPVPPPRSCVGKTERPAKTWVRLDSASQHSGTTTPEMPYGRRHLFPPQTRGRGNLLRHRCAKLSRSDDVRPPGSRPVSQSAAGYPPVGPLGRRSHGGGV